MTSIINYDVEHHPRRKPPPEHRIRLIALEQMNVRIVIAEIHSNVHTVALAAVKIFSERFQPVAELIADLQKIDRMIAQMLEILLVDRSVAVMARAFIGAMLDAKCVQSHANAFSIISFGVAIPPTLGKCCGASGGLWLQN